MSRKNATIFMFTYTSQTLAVIHTHAHSFTYKSTLINVQEHTNTTYDKYC